MTEEKGVVATNDSPAEMIRQAVKGGADLEKLQGLLDLQLKWEANEARKAYHKAMAEFKLNPPEIVKDKHVKFATSKGTMDYNHATLANVSGKINAALSKHGLSAAWVTQQNGSIAVTCKITHSMGHSEETTLSANADTTGLKNSIQAMGSTITYLQRYSLLSLTGLATRDGDNDGQSSEVEYLDEKQLSTIRDYVDNNEGFEERLLKYLNIESIDKMPKTDYDKAVKAMEAKK